MFNNGNRQAGTQKQPGSSTETLRWKKGDIIVAQHIALFASSRMPLICFDCSKVILPGDLRYRYAFMRGNKLRVGLEHVDCLSRIPVREFSTLITTTGNSITEAMAAAT